MITIKEKAAFLRKNLTLQEKKLWNIIRNKQINNYKFLRQYIIGNYIVDFVCREKKLIIEIDGGQHNESSKTEYDNKRTKYFESLGFKVLRFWNNEIDDNIEGVYEELLKYLD